MLNIKSEVSRFSHSLLRKKFRFLWNKFNLVSKLFSSIESHFFKFFTNEFSFSAQSLTQDFENFSSLLIRFSKVNSTQLNLPSSFKEIVKLDEIMCKTPLITTDEVNESNAGVTNLLDNLVQFENMDYIVKSPISTVMEFKYNVLDLYNGLSPELLTIESQFVAFTPSNTSFSTEVYSLSPTVFHLINLLHEPKPVEIIIQEVAHINNMQNISEQIRQDCIQAIMDLCQMRILLPYQNTI